MYRILDPSKKRRLTSLAFFFPQNHFFIDFIFLDDDGVKPRNKRKKRNSTENRPQNNERQVRRKYRKHLIANCTKLRENDIMTDCEIKVMDMPVCL